MASQNKLRRDDSDNKVLDLLSVVEKLEIHQSLVGNEGNSSNDPLQIISPSLLYPNEDGHLLKVRRNLELLIDGLTNLQELQEKVNRELTGHCTLLEEHLEQVKVSRVSSGISSWTRRDVEYVNGKISDLSHKLSSLPEKWKADKVDVFERKNNGREIVALPGLYANKEHFTKLQAFRQVKQEFMELAIERKMCLLSFGMFPENREVHRTMLMYWWIGEGIIRTEGAEETVREVLKDFTDKKLVEPIEERRKLAPSSYKMNLFVHSSVIYLSQEIGLFNIYRKGKEPKMSISRMGKVCLVDGSSNQVEAKRKRMPFQDIESVFNVSERKPEFALKWFLEHPSGRKLFKLSEPYFKSLHVFYLGRWERTQKRHIYVSNPELIKCLKLMKNLKLLSFQGIATITRLGSWACNLRKLIVLDLRECSDLSKLPEMIDSLHSLIYLDMTGCYMLAWIPMRLHLLKNLEVIKGFVVSNTVYNRVACTLGLLKRLKKLRKLSIEIHRDDLGVHQLMEDLVNLKALTSLRVIWRMELKNIVHADKPEDFTGIESLPHQLKKLYLQRYPHENLPTWLNPHNLLHLKKLHIGGGRTLKGFGELPEKATECSVEVLRLTSLPKLRVRWIELKQLYFPNLIFLEKYECPRVSLTPCDGNGIWRSDQDD